MKQFRVLNATIEADRQEWVSIWSSWRGKEVFAHPDYVALFARVVDDVLCICHSFPAGMIILPVIRRPIRAEPWGGAPLPELYDCITPYGYGGPYIIGVVCAEEFFIRLAESFKAMSVVALFGRLSLFSEQIAVPLTDVAISAENIVRSLSLSADELWISYEYKVRKNVNKAKRYGLRVTYDSSGENLDSFIEIYLATMQRRGALQGYYFSRGFFENIATNLAGSCMWFHVWDGPRIVSTELVLISDSYVYSYLGGTVADAFQRCPNDLLKHEIILWAKAAGKAGFVLGGGYAKDDGIFRYKKCFAPDGVREFRTWRWVIDLGAYDALIRARELFEAAAGKPWATVASYFPAYRG